MACARPLKRRCEISVVQALPSSQIPLDDHVPQPLDDRFMKWLRPFDYGDGPSRATSRRRFVGEITQRRLVRLGPFGVLSRNAQKMTILHTKCKK
jgi:hypothetical protein